MNIIIKSGCCLLSFCLFVVGNPAKVSCAEQEPAFTGLHRFTTGDDPAWALPGYDDSRWKDISADGQAWTSKILTPTAWYRIHLAAGSFPDDLQPAVFLGRLGDADEVYLNGVKIGGEGTIGDRFVMAARAERLYRIPQNLLRPEGENLLAVRVMDFYPKGRTFDIPVIIGVHSDLLAQKMNLQFATKVVEFIIFTFLFN